MSLLLDQVLVAVSFPTSRLALRISRFPTFLGSRRSLGYGLAAPSHSDAAVVFVRGRDTLPDVVMRLLPDRTISNVIMGTILWYYNAWCALASQGYSAL